MTDLTLFDVQDGIATLTLNEPDRLNPLSADMLDGILAALHRVRDDKGIRALLLTASGRGFCVGADLEDFGRRAARDEPLGRHVGRLMEARANPMIAGLRSLPVPVVCAINGVAAGGGAGLALAGDMVVAARSAYFYLPFVPALGLVPDMGSSWVLPRAVGRPRALGLALTGEKLPAAKAAEWGLIWSCVDDASLQQEARSLAARLALLPGHAIVEAREAFAASERNNLERQLARERERMEVLLDQSSFGEGLRAFAERRPPVFSGRG